MSAVQKPIEGPMPLTEEWKSLRLFDPERPKRKVLFGASEAAQACGMSPYGGPLDLFLLKLGRKKAFEGNDATEMGLALEPVVLALYSQRTKVVIQTGLPMFFHPSLEFMAATPDAFVVTPVTDTIRAVAWGVDAKTSTYRRYDFDGEDEGKFGREGTDQLPVDYILQGQQQMEVLGLDRIDFPVLFDGRTMRTYTVQRNQDLIDLIISSEKELAERIINNDPPEPNWTHPNTKGNLRDLFGLTLSKRIELDDETAKHWLAMQKLKVAKANIEAEIEGYKNRILYAMQDAQTGLLPKGEKELHRTIIADSFWTQQDAEKVLASIGQIKHKGHDRLGERKVK